MIRTASASDVLCAIEHAHTVLLSAYVLRPGQLLDALEGAARRGARVTVRLEGRPYAGSDQNEASRLAAQNLDAVAALGAAGGDAAMVDTSNADGPPLHLKAAVCDGVAYLDDRNWPDDGADTILRDGFPRDVAAIEGALLRTQAPPVKWFWSNKAQALAGETRLLYSARHARQVDVESESFGRDGAYAALKALTAAGVHCRLLVARRDVNPKSQQALEELERDGVHVRTGDFDEKMAIVDGARAWTGSANATYGYPDQLDWGVRTDSPEVVRVLESHFNAHWNESSHYT
ncbi:MAG TPA: phospholipase D-like domain-containing protein [Candidatus Baltobacteraceae bacterium]|nr:phospholipase D-like domain-containing protein [Candidatus Baltobacteraceae bacterium]